MESEIKNNEEKFKNTWKSKAGYFWIILLVYIASCFFIKIDLVMKLLMGFGIFFALYFTITNLFWCEYIQEKTWELKKNETRKI